MGEECFVAERFSDIQYMENVDGNDTTSPRSRLITVWAVEPRRNVAPKDSPTATLSDLDNEHL